MRTTPAHKTPVKPSAAGPEAPRAGDPALDRLSELRSGDPARVRAALSGAAPFDPVVVPQAVRLLAWNEVSDTARRFLAHHCQRVLGQLTDALLDPDGDFAVRRRIPRILAHSASQRAVDGLQPALDDAHFEIRFQAGRALEYLHRMHAELAFDHAAVMRVVERELSVSSAIWQGRRLLDERDESDTPYAFLDELVRDRAQQSLEHVFSLLAIVLPREPLKVAYRALHSDHRLLRGLALEYLETVLPGGTFALLLGVLDYGPPPQTGRDPHTVLEKLMASQESIKAGLRPSSAGVREPGATPPTATPA
jgi:hypothetical protein